MSLSATTVWRKYTVPKKTGENRAVRQGPEKLGR
jgi:hypothetical protein